MKMQSEATDKKRRITWKVKEEELGWSIEEILKKHLGFTKKQISRMKFRDQGICIDGIQRRSSYCPQPGQELSICLEDGEKQGRSRCPGEIGALTIVYEDQDLLILDKPSGMVCHPSHGHHRDTLANLAAGYLEEKGENPAVHLCGRLDKDTSGLVVFAKNQITAARLGSQREKGEFYKEYLAVTEGVPDPPLGEICRPIGPVWGSLQKMQVDERGKYACTYYQVKRIRKVKLSGEDVMCSLTVCRLKTGRTHQIRVHMADMGCPLVGDSLYGSGRIPDILSTHTVMGLHAWKIHLYQPFTGEKITVVSEKKDVFGI